ncbi:MAG: hypothetical protein LBL98_01425 [Ruminococcus sp.]|jgi:hypothetical protein|nr:hypothetical protein [Ruminococcus sp.]
MKKMVTYIIVGITGFLLINNIRTIPSLLNFEYTADYSVVDIYDLPDPTYGEVENLSVTVETVVADGGNIPVYDGHYFVVVAGDAYSDADLMLQMIVSDDQTIRGLSALASNSAAPAVTVKGYLGAVPESYKEELIEGFTASGISRSEAEQFYDENIFDAVFVEDGMMTDFGNIFAYILMGVTVAMVVISILLLRSLKKDEEGKRYSEPPNGYIPPQSVSPNGFVPPNSGGYIPPPGSVPPGGYVPVDETAFDPTKIKQPDYNDFFNEKKPSKPETPAKKPDTISDLYDVEMEAVSIPVLPSAKPEDNDFLELPSAEEINSSLGDDPISDMNLDEYMSADFLSADFTPDNPND